MKFIHCADLHLDSKIENISTEKSKKRRDEILSTFERLADFATERQVTAIIIAGDMFDTARVTEKTKNRVISAINRNSTVDFLYLSGNHDEDNFISSLEQIPSNLKIFGDSWTAFNYGEVTISGIRFTPINLKTVYDSLNLSPKQVNIAVMHGQIAGYKSQMDAEIISLPKLRDKNIDYLALGHIHGYATGEIDLRGKYAYSGCLDGRGFDETGEKGFVLIDVENGKLSTEFTPFSSRDIFTVEMSVEDKQSWYTAQGDFIEELKSKYSKTNLIKVVLKGGRKADFEIDLQNFTNKLNEYFFFAKVYDKTELKIDENDFAFDKSVRGEFVRAVLASNLTDEEKKQIILVGLNALKGEDL